ncbi:prion-inhibition and propagation, helo domain-containing protein, partial [Diaporthe sp. PMI_573]
GLAGLFSTCLDAIEKIDCYRGFGRDSRSLEAQFKAFRLCLSRWGQAVGFKDGQILEDHHPNLNNPQTRVVVMEVLSLIHDFYGEAENAIGDSSFLTDADAEPLPTRQAGPVWNTPLVSKRQKLAWTFRGKGKRTAKVEGFGKLVQHLRDLVPPNSIDEARMDPGSFTAGKHSHDVCDARKCIN